MRIRQITTAAAVVVAVSAVVAAPPAAAADFLPVLSPGTPVTALGGINHDDGLCTAGFVVRNTRGAPIMLTAGHCDGGGPVTVRYPETGGLLPVGTFIVNRYTPPFSDTSSDIAAVKLSDSSIPVSAALMNRAPVAGWTIPEVGQLLCKIGAKTGRSCGKVWKVTRNKVYFGALNQKGDSGGPVFAVNDDGTVTAVGVTSGMPEQSLVCEIDDNSKVCGGSTFAELIGPWMKAWDLRF